MPQKTEIESLVYLLEDPDPYVQDQIKKRLYELGEGAVPLLDQQKSGMADEAKRALINDIIRTITHGHAEEDFVDILNNGLTNLKQLEEAVLVLSRFSNPTLRTGEYRRKLDHFAEAIRPKIRYEPDETRQMHILLEDVFDTLGFSGSTAHYYNPENAFLDRVIDRRRGLPISLAFVVLFLGRRLGLPFKGVNMPIHFMLKYKSSKEDILIDPFDHGKTVSYSQCHYFLKQNGIEPKPAHFEEATEAVMLARCISNLINSYSRDGQENQADDLKKILRMLEALCF